MLTPQDFNARTPHDLAVLGSTLFNHLKKLPKYKDCLESSLNTGTLGHAIDGMTEEGLLSLIRRVADELTKAVPLGALDVRIARTIFEEDTPVRGNLICSDDDEFDKREEDAVLRRLEDGEVCAWCIAFVKVFYEGLEGWAALHGCNYETEESLWEDQFDWLLSEALNDLNAQRMKGNNKTRTPDSALRLVEFPTNF